MGKTVKTCITCKHYQQQVYDGPVCARSWLIPPRVNPVTGRKEQGFHRKCEDERRDSFSSDCGYRGSKWESPTPTGVERALIAVLQWIR